MLVDRADDARELAPRGSQRNWEETTRFTGGLGADLLLMNGEPNSFVAKPRSTVRA